MNIAVLTAGGIGSRTCILQTLDNTVAFSFVRRCPVQN